MKNKLLINIALLSIGFSLQQNIVAQQVPTTTSPALPALNGRDARDFWSRAGNSGIGINNQNNIFEWNYFEPKVVIVSHLVVPAKRPIGSDSYLECWATPDSGAGCAACNKSARTPPTKVPRFPCTFQTAPSALNNPASSPLAISRAQSGKPSLDPETFLRKASAKGLVRKNL